ncbi:phosphoenolpyruvate--protein phosphotransferase [Paenibacillus radicis (ex Gao et al. 2016)]|uniref:Phosphoenolpyruvate-protein phosphotransferase n=1 Tax=Paenibacillus radicis (ex Gao et al. 2016) TaxID=1737354 RepID=A0A917H4S1_9BACL|nr:phosphoenolpyruvate--protein phosphotransferase [Paenibacillus radicis (ex Gao et al. 2016)]GGG67183.1 phosphoenolpyruvate-protein phosphotransferase [Paenibacillus radicis (ex Gao et al. 2016)]
MTQPQLQGIAASPGIAIARAIRIDLEEYIPEKTTVQDPKQEVARFRQAVEAAGEQIEGIREATEQKLGAEKAEIFEGHLLLLEDPELIDVVVENIENDAVNAEYALYEVSQSFIEMLSQLDDEMLRERAVDIRDVRGRVLNLLRGVGGSDHTQLQEECIIIARDLTPSDTAQLNLEAVRGFVTEIGSRTSHSAIMARSLDIPAIVGAGAAIQEIQNGDLIVMDAVEGQVWINPDSSSLEQFRVNKARYDQRKAELAVWVDKPSLAKDGHRIELAANIGKLDDVQKALDNGAEGIGLFRTEFLYMGRQELPSEEEQFQSYKYVLEKMAGKPVVIRTLDIGGDKELPYMDLPKESNPFLGQRALRLCLERDDLFRTQLRALLRASQYGNLKIMFPMIAVRDELFEAKRILKEEKQLLIEAGVAVSESIEIGMMIEIPSAAISADLFAPHVDFFSIGTNDLIQYTMAADRMNETVSYLYQPSHPSILRLIRLVIEAARQEGKWVGLCGEMAGDLASVPLLLGLGLHEFSMSAGSLLQTRELIAGLNYAQWQEHAKQALTLGSQQEVQAFVQEIQKGENE